MHSLNETGAHLSFFEDTHIYWEKQELWRLCGLHSINSIMQGPYFNEVELSEIAHELDKKEKKLMEELGTETIDFLQYMAQDSFNVSEDGNFSVQVLEEALAKKNIKMTLIGTKKEISSLYKLFSEETAMICNSGMHWFALRKINKTWYDLNSTNNFPEIMSENRITEFLEMCVNFEYMLYAVRGNFPEHTFKEMKGKTDSKRQFWLKESHIKELNEKGQGPSSIQSPQTQSSESSPSLNSHHVPTGAAAIHNLEKSYILLGQKNKVPLDPAPTVNKFEMKLDENIDNMVLNFRLPNAQLIYHVFPRSWFLEDLYEYINYKTNNSLKGRFQIITNYPDFMVLPPTKIMISKTALTAGQTLFIRTL